MLLFSAAGAMMLIHVYQVPVAHEYLSEHTDGWLGTLYYKQFKGNNWPVLVGYSAIVLLFLLVCMHTIKVAPP